MWPQSRKTEEPQSHRATKPHSHKAAKPQSQKAQSHKAAKPQNYKASKQQSHEVTKPPAMANRNSDGEQKLLMVSNEDIISTNINTIYTIIIIVYVEIICNMKTKEYQD